ncbi:MAG TPA: DNA mismatch repair protein MutT [Prevotella sp.]|nr:DNA mismatch repair protein MutT [Candidatus Segatella violae]
MAHVLDKFKYCPACGSHHFEINNFKSKKCSTCGFTYYANPSSATVAFIQNEKGELLVVRRKNEPAKGTLDLPGGFVDMDETGEEGVSREVKEETGLKATEVTYLFSIPNLYLYSGFLVHTLDMFYRVKVKDLSHIEAMDDAAEYYWIPLSELHPEDFGLQSISNGVRRFLVKKDKKNTI